VRVAVLGGVPASIGGGGLEVQIRATRAALERLGVEVFHVAEEPGGRPFDVLHAFGAGPDNWHVLGNWTRNRSAPLVLSPVWVVPPGARELRLRAAARVPVPGFLPRMHVEVLRRARALVALTEDERRFLRAVLGRHSPRVDVIGNGVDPLSPADVAGLGLPERYVVLLGAISARKRQAETLEALAGRGPTPVAIGPIEDPAFNLAAWEETVRRTGAVWLGRVDDPRVVRAVLRGAQALLHLSAAEGQSLAVLEALACGTPVVLSPLASSRELAERYPEHVHLVAGETELLATLATLSRPADPPAVPTWDEVARALTALYAQVAGRP
jgi:glycosyltransferase involved in cell wall biosynthesis